MMDEGGNAANAVGRGATPTGSFKDHEMPLKTRRNTLEMIDAFVECLNGVCVWGGGEYQINHRPHNYCNNKQVVDLRATASIKNSIIQILRHSPHKILH